MQVVATVAHEKAYPKTHAEASSQSPSIRGHAPQQPPSNVTEYRKREENKGRKMQRIKSVAHTGSTVYRQVGEIARRGGTKMEGDVLG
jgi:hypothetical protein